MICSLWYMLNGTTCSLQRDSPRQIPHQHFLSVFVIKGQLAIADQIRIKSSNVYCPHPSIPEKTTSLPRGRSAYFVTFGSQPLLKNRLAGMDVNATYCSKNSFIKVTDFFSVMTNTVSKKPPIYKVLWVAGISGGGGGDTIQHWMVGMRQQSVLSIYLHLSLIFWCTVFIS